MAIKAVNAEDFNTSSTLLKQYYDEIEYNPTTNTNDPNKFRRVHKFNDIARPIQAWSERKADLNNPLYKKNPQNIPSYLERIKRIFCAVVNFLSFGHLQFQTDQQIEDLKDQEKLAFQERQVALWKSDAQQSVNKLTAEEKPLFLIYLQKHQAPTPDERHEKMRLSPVTLTFVSPEAIQDYVTELN